MAFFPCVGPQVEDKIVMSGNPLSFETDDAQLAQDVAVTYDITQSGSGDPSPSNVRPFVGQDSLTLTVPRKNLWRGGDVSGTRSAQVRTIWLPAGTYTVSAVVTSSDTDDTTSRILVYTEAGNLNVYLNRNTRSSATFTTEGRASLFAFYASSDSTKSIGDTFTYADIQIEKGETATTYEPYNPITDISISLGETIFCGTWDIEKGLLTITHKKIILTGSENWSENTLNPYTYRMPRPSDGKRNTPIYSDMYPYEPGALAEITYAIVMGSYLNIKDAVNGTTLANFKSYIGSHNVTVVYELATPIVLHLPGHAVNLLNGANIITSNGTSMILKYRKGEIPKLEDLSGIGDAINSQGDLIDELIDTWPETDKTLAKREGATASKAYTIGEWIVDSEGYSGIVIRSVSQGSEWTLGTNYSRHNRSDSASCFIRLGAVSDTTKTYSEVLNAFWNLISSVSSSRKMNLAIGEAGTGGRRYISRVQLISNTDAYFQRMMLSMSNQGRIDIAQFYCNATNSKAATNNGGTYTDLSSNTITGTMELLLFI